MKKLKFYLLMLLCCVEGISAQSFSYSTQDVWADLKYFKDWTASELTDHFKIQDLKKIKSQPMRQLAQDLFSKKYQAQYLLNAYDAIPSNKVLERSLKLFSGYSQYENMTGVYLEQGEHIVLVGDLHGRDVGLLIPDWTRQPTPGFDPIDDPEGWDLKKQEISLHEGVNVIYVKKSGNVYLNYFADDPETAPKITVHFVTGKVNGYFDAGIHTDEDWNRLLDNAVSPIMDIKTKYMQIAYPVEYLKKFVYGAGKKMAEDYDKIMYRQYEFSGAIKYNRVPNKRLLARVNYNYFMFRDEDGVAFIGDEQTMKSVMGSEVLTNWGISHEIGHVMQMVPQMTWSGMTEVSNNLFSMYVVKHFGAPGSLTQYDIYEAAFEKVLHGDKKRFIMCVEDPFHKLVPFWQLQIYANKIGRKDFYADIMEYLRNHPHKGVGDNSINNMYEFIKLCCDYTKTDLIDFFDAWGFFETGTFEVDDYGKYIVNVTPEMIKETKDYILSKKYSKPNMDITKLTD